MRRDKGSPRPQGEDSAPAELTGAGVAYVLAIATGLLVFLAFPSLDVWPLSFVAYVPLIVAIEGRPPRRSFGLGFTAGVVMNVCGLRWLFSTIWRFSGLSVPVCALLALAVCTYQALPVGLFGFLHARARQRGWPKLASLVAAFVASELAWPLVFPWTFGACAHRLPALMQWAEVGGPYLVSLLLLAPSVGVGHAVVQQLRGQAIPRGVVALALGIPLGAALIGEVQIWRVDRRVADAPQVHVGLAQANLDAPSLSERVERVNRELRITEELRRKGVDFVVWPETVVLGVPSDLAETYLQTFFSRRLNVPTLIGAVLVRGDGRDRHLLNSVLSTKKDGRLSGHYEKHLLFPVGERLPLFETFPGLYRGLPGAINFAPGTSFEPLLVAGHPVTALVCYEDVFPAFVNEAVGAGRSEMLVNLTNDAWFGDTSEPWIHLALAQFRAVEHRRYLVRATNTGVSAIIDPTGKILVQGAMFREDAVDGVARWVSGPRTAYEVWGNAPWWLLTVGAVVMAIRRRPGRSAVEPPKRDPSAANA
jgi:apolipoprotein N-acyltransferase